MSESSISTAAVPAWRNRLWMIVIPAFVILLGLVYLGGYYILPSMIRSAFQENNCAAVLSRADVYSRYYTVTDKDMSAQIGECAVYTLALRHQQDSAWQEAYNAFTVYSQAYPQGRFAADVHQQLSSVLIGLARDEMDRRNHARALTWIDRVLQEYDDPAIVQEAQSLRLELLLDWGTNLREESRFAEAIHIFTEVQNSAVPKYEESAGLGLAQTYLAWGHALLSQHEFDAAKAKIEVAISMDPDVQSTADQAEFYKQWGDYLVEQGDYSNAMTRYAAAAAMIKADDPTRANEIIANGYIQWGHALSARQDFIGALVLLDFAQANAAGDQTKELIDSARSDVYLGFSRSDGEQAQQVMLAAANIICEHQIPSRLPILGLDSENVRTSIHGLEGDLPQTLAVTTPGSMHYVACVEVSTSIVASVVNRIISAVLGIGPPYKFLPITYERIQHIWNVTLRDAETGMEVATTVIEGGEPPPFPVTLFEIQQRARDPRFWGTQPEFSDLVTWLQSETQ